MIQNYVYYLRIFSSNHYKNILSSMLFPKLSLRKPKLSLAQKSIQNINVLIHDSSSKKEQKQKIFRNSGIISGPKHQNRCLSSSLNKNRKLSRNSLIAKKIDPSQKQNKEILKPNKIQEKSQHKLSLRLSECLKSDQLEPSRFSRIQSIENIQKQDLIIKQLSQSEQLSSIKKTIQSNSYSTLSTSQNTLKLTEFLLKSQQKNSTKKMNSLKNKQSCQEQNQFSFQNCQNINKPFTKSQCPLRDSKRLTSYERQQTFMKEATNYCLQLESSVFSFKIESPNKILSPKKRLLIQSLINDTDFEWKYEKFREYAQKYSQYEIKLKQNFQTLQLLTQNIQLLKERIIPSKQYATLKEVIDIVKPTMTQKQEKAYQTKMTMLEWKKKFFTKVRKIKDKLNNSYQEKCEAILIKLQQNQEVALEAWQKINDHAKNETVIFQKEDIFKLKNTLQTISLNQKQMIDYVRMIQNNNENFHEKLNVIEEQWSHAFDIFNFTLENCAKKCITLSETIEKFYGKCSTAVFLTKGIEKDKEKDIKLIQNDKCHVCCWNETKIKKIIEQNSLARDFLGALKHLVAH